MAALYPYTLISRPNKLLSQSRESESNERIIRQRSAQLKVFTGVSIVQLLIKTVAGRYVFNEVHYLATHSSFTAALAIHMIGTCCAMLRPFSDRSRQSVLYQVFIAGLFYISYAAKFLLFFPLGGQSQCAGYLLL